ncbi:MAG: tripartite tricarboxylate transporter permease [Hyphomicrobiales bacterium]|nr:tripartite tricarboxylate transporter permease [Hyphomicrobiales bacterium]
MIEALGQAFGSLLTVSNLIMLFSGAVMGLAIGALPGLGGIAGLSLMLPFLYGMDPVAGMALMIGLVAVIPTSDTFTSVLMGIPGSSSSQATVLDGFPLAKQGFAARALSAAFIASLFGGIVGAVILTFFVLIARPLILTFRTPELLMLVILGFSMVGVLAGRSLGKGLVSAALGMLVASIGNAPAQGTERLTMNVDYLMDGLQLVIVGLGIFALPEIITLLRRDVPVSEETRLGKGWLQGLIDWWKNIWLSARCAVIGVVVGVVPGLGGSVVDWIAYAHLTQTTKDRSKLGKGDIRGVIAPESANNAKEGGALVPTLLFGIPGSGSMAIFLGGMTVLGLEAGPMMITNQLSTTYTIVWSLALANVIGAGLCLMLAPFISQLTRIRFPLIAPFMLMFIVFAAFQSRQSLWDLVSLLGIGIIALYMKRFDWPRPAFLIGFVLAKAAETYTYQATQYTLERGLSYIMTPTVIILLILTIGSIYVGLRQNKQMSHGEQLNEMVEKQSRMPQLIFASLVTVYFIYALWDLQDIPALIDRVFPVTVTILALPFLLVVLWQLAFAPKQHAAVYDDEIVGEDSTDPDRYGVWSTLVWFLGLLGLSAVFGFLIANVVFFFTFLRFRAKASWLVTSVLTIAANGFILFLAWLLNRDFPPGLLQAYTDLPWPFR